MRHRGDRLGRTRGQLRAGLRRRRAATNGQTSSPVWQSISQSRRRRYCGLHQQRLGIWHEPALLIIRWWSRDLSTRPCGRRRVDDVHEDGDGHAQRRERRQHRTASGANGTVLQVHRVTPRPPRTPFLSSSATTGTGSQVTRDNGGTWSTVTGLRRRCGSASSPGVTTTSAATSSGVRWRQLHRHSSGSPAASPTRQWAFGICDERATPSMSTSCGTKRRRFLRRPSQLSARMARAEPSSTYQRRCRPSSTGFSVSAVGVTGGDFRTNAASCPSTSLNGTSAHSRNHLRLANTPRRRAASPIDTSGVVSGGAVTWTVLFVGVGSLDADGLAPRAALC